MRRPILKNSNKKLKGNISLLVILILLASSVIGLLSINQIQRLITYGNMTFNYFRAFYLAKAGTELGLTEVYYREAGFNHKIENEKDNDGNITEYHSIIQNNFLGEKVEEGEVRKYEAFNPYFEMTISGSFKTLTNDVRNSECEGNEIVLGSGAGIMISLFSDETEGLDEILTGESNNIRHLTSVKNLNLSNTSWSGQKNNYFTFGLFTYSGSLKNLEMDSVEVKTGADLSNILDSYNSKNNKRSYLTIKNSSDDNVSFCIYMNESLIPSSDSLITVRGNYGDMEVGIQSVVKKGVPDWALNVLGEGGGE